LNVLIGLMCFTPYKVVKLEKRLGIAATQECVMTSGIMQVYLVAVERKAILYHLALCGTSHEGSVKDCILSTLCKVRNVVLESTWKLIFLLHPRERLQPDMSICMGVDVPEFTTKLEKRSSKFIVT